MVHGWNVQKWILKLELLFVLIVVCSCQRKKIMLKSDILVCVKKKSQHLMEYRGFDPSTNNHPADATVPSF